jgi:excisionase family DNA binding protein
MEPDEKLLTPAEAGSYLRVSERYVRTLMANGALPTVAIGKRKFIRHADLNDYIRAQRVTQPQ